MFQFELLDIGEYSSCSALSGFTYILVLACTLFGDVNCGDDTVTSGAHGVVVRRWLCHARTVGYCLWHWSWRYWSFFEVVVLVVVIGWLVEG